MLDYDGTLAPFTVERDKAYVPVALSAVLNRLSMNTLNIVAVVSGRVAEEVARLLRASHVVRIPLIFGSHGSESIDWNGVSHRIDIDKESLVGLDRVYDLLLRKIDSTLVERKYASIAVHVRGMERGEADKVLRFAVSVFRDSSVPGFRIVEFNGGVELRSRASDKGKAVASLLKRYPEATAVYLGDDETDEDAFRELKGKGLSIRIGDEGMDTCADVVFQRWEVGDFLKRFE